MVLGGKGNRSSRRKLPTSGDHYPATYRHWYLIPGTPEFDPGPQWWQVRVLPLPPIRVPQFMWFKSLEYVRNISQWKTNLVHVDEMFCVHKIQVKITMTGGDFNRINYMRFFSLIIFALCLRSSARDLNCPLFSYHDLCHDMFAYIVFALRSSHTRSYNYRIARFVRNLADVRPVFSFT